MSIHDIIINGESSDYISSLDRGLLYGDGVFETIAVKQGQLQYWDEHIARLISGCDVLNLSEIDLAVLLQEAKQLIADDLQCIIKIIITRGVGGRGYKYEQQKNVTRILQKFSWPEFPHSYTKLGINVKLCDFRLATQPRLAGIKHLNRLEQVIAASEWSDEFQEGLVCDMNDHIIEATSHNVFFQANEILITPKITNCGVAGVLREKIIDYCKKHNFTLEIRDFHLKEIKDIQAMFLSNSISSIWPVKNFNGRALSKTVIIDNLMQAFND